ncbi:hypothetical protein [Streptomyces sp. NPDC057428]|uniref:hypothetical protein n=1 Tax=Streptomyces sp. NPDC057428 TaxID=3346129 RepID=UPI0036925783
MEKESAPRPQGILRVCAGRRWAVVGSGSRAVGSVRPRAYHVLDLRDGKVVRHEAVRDDVTMLGQLGVFPPTPATMVRMVGWKVSGRASKAAAHVTEQAAEAAALVNRAS